MVAHHHELTIAGTTGGMLLTLFANIHSDDLFKTAVLSVIGACISYGVTIGLRWIRQQLRRK